MRNNLVITFFFLFTSVLSQQPFNYRTIPAEMKSKIAVTDLERSQIKNQYFASGKDLTAYLPVNFDRTGKTDYTYNLQKGLNENLVVLMPNFPILIAPQGLQIKSGSKILFQKNSQLIVKNNNKEFYAALNLENVENAHIYFANLVGDRYQHLSTKGEWGMGIYIVHSKNISILKPTITKFWGDGLYIGKLDGITSNNIFVNSAFIDENRRNGISIIAGEKITIINSIISNTYGASPEYGIDIEPNKPEDFLKDIFLANNITYNNFKGGLLFALDNLKGKNDQEIGVQVNNHYDYYSDKGIEFHIDRGYQKYLVPIKGAITINGANLYYNKTALINNDSKPAQIKLNLFNIKSDNIKFNTFKMNTFVEKFKQGKQQSY